MEDRARGCFQLSARNLRTALHGDTVKVRLFALRKGARPEGRSLRFSPATAILL
ncbi:MAG: hypothetical protein MZV63_62950 [Marinilabiliales bacterium]|nr:hypothetical protein [Marinilabiliales bacterium]